MNKELISILNNEIKKERKEKFIGIETMPESGKRAIEMSPVTDEPDDFLQIENKLFIVGNWVYKFVIDKKYSTELKKEVFQYTAQPQEVYYK